MRRSRGLVLLFGLLFTTAGGCSLAVDTSDVDARCPSGQKLCGRKCVALDDPAYGCELEGCEPCQLINALPACREGACSVKACLYGFGCPTNKGCEVFVRVNGLDTCND